MTDAENKPDLKTIRLDNAQNWAPAGASMQISHVPTWALNLNIEGRQLVGPLQGFGQLWERTYRVRLTGIDLTPAEVMEIWKNHFTSFLPLNQRFFPATQLEPGELVLINASVTGMPVSTGVMVLYSDDESLTLITPQGHPESGWNTFSTYTEDGCTVCQIQSLARANDPIYELGFRIFGAKTQLQIWTHVLQSLAGHFNVNGQVHSFQTCVDPRLQWSQARNIWQNAAIRTLIYTLCTPQRWFKRASQAKNAKVS